MKVKDAWVRVRLGFFALVLSIMLPSGQPLLDAIDSALYIAGAAMMLFGLSQGVYDWLKRRALSQRSDNSCLPADEPRLLHRKLNLP